MRHKQKTCWTHTPSPKALFVVLFSLCTKTNRGAFESSKWKLLCFNFPPLRLPLCALSLVCAHCVSIAPHCRVHYFWLQWSFDCFALIVVVCTHCETREFSLHETGMSARCSSPVQQRDDAAKIYCRQLLFPILGKPMRRRVNVKVINSLVFIPPECCCCSSMQSE